MLFEYLISLELLLLDVLLRVIQGNIRHTLAALPNKLFEKKVISSSLHVVAIGLYEPFDLFNLKILAIFN